MTKYAIHTIQLMLIAGFLVGLSSCAVVTRSTEGSTETFHNTSDASTEFTSSTSPRSEDESSETRKVKAFAAANLDRLKEDMSRGNGEHLTAFAHLLGIKETHQAEFYSMTKDKYPDLFRSEPTTSDTLLARLETELNGHPTWRN